MTATITTSGTLLVNGGHSTTLNILAGSVTSVPYTLYQPDDGTTAEWVNITLSGACVDAGQVSVTTQSRLQAITPRMLQFIFLPLPRLVIHFIVLIASVNCYNDLGFLIGGGAFLVSLYIHPLPSLPSDAFNVTFTPLDHMITAAPFEVTPTWTPAPKVFGTLPTLSPGKHQITWSLSGSGSLSSGSGGRYEALPINGFTIDVWPLYMTFVTPTLIPAVSPWGSMASTSVGFQGYPPADMWIQPYCEYISLHRPLFLLIYMTRSISLFCMFVRVGGVCSDDCGSFGAMAFTVGSTSASMVFTAGYVTGTFLVYFNW